MKIGESYERETNKSKKWFTKPRVFKLILLYLVLDIYIVILPVGFPRPNRTQLYEQEEMLEKNNVTDEKPYYFVRKKPQKLTIFDAYSLYYGPCYDP